MNLTCIRSTIEHLLSETMLGRSKLDPRLLLVAHALLSQVEHPGRIWRICRVASEAASNRDSITLKRKALVNGTSIPSESNFDVAEDTWVCYVALEAADEQRRVIAVEILDPYAYDDSGYIVNVSALPAVPLLPKGEVQQWVLDFENVAGVSQIPGTAQNSPT